MDGIKFEKVSRFAETDISLPVRKTKASAGYDFEVAEDIVIEPYDKLMMDLDQEMGFKPFMDAMITGTAPVLKNYTLDEVAAATKKTRAKPSLVATGVKCRMPENTYLELNIRSSCPLKYWLILANSVGVIDADYYNNPDNEGEIFFQIYNLSPFNIQIKKGEAIGQAIILPYAVTDDDAACGERTGGFGSTSK